MAQPLTADAFELKSRSAGLQLQQHDGWRTRNRGTRGDGWGPVHGVMVHHTVTLELQATLRLVIQGQSKAVPGPLYAGIVDELGRLHMVGWGRCNHAGLGDDDVLRAVIAERATPAPNELNTDGNARFYGFAFVNLGDGIDPYSRAQLATMAKVCGVICRHHGWTARSVIGHKQWQRGKIDPHGPQGYLIPNLQKAVATQLRK